MPRHDDATTGWLGCKATLDMIERIDELAGRGQLSRSEVIRLALERLVDEDLPATLVASADVRRSARLTTGSRAAAVEV